MSGIVIFKVIVLKTKVKNSKKNDDEHRIDCPECPSEADIYWDPRYNGKRGSCSGCGTSWAES